MEPLAASGRWDDSQPALRVTAADAPLEVRCGAVQDEVKHHGRPSRLTFARRCPDADRVMSRPVPGWRSFLALCPSATTACRAMLPVASFVTMDVGFVITDVGFHRGWCGLPQQDHPATHHGEALISCSFPPGSCAGSDRRCPRSAATGGVLRGVATPGVSDGLSGQSSFQLLSAAPVIARLAACRCRRCRGGRPCPGRCPGTVPPWRPGLPRPARRSPPPGR